MYSFADLWAIGDNCKQAIEAIDDLYKHVDNMREGITDRAVAARLHILANRKGVLKDLKKEAALAMRELEVRHGNIDFQSLYLGED